LSESTPTAILFGLLGGLGLALGGFVIADGFAPYLYSLSLFPNFFFMDLVLIIPIILNLTLGFALIRERPKTGKVMMIGGTALSIGLVLKFFPWILGLGGS
jgi:hypothetical protein